MLRPRTVSEKHKNSLSKEFHLVDQPSECGRGKFGSFTEPGPATTNFKKRSDLLGKNTFPGHARVPLCVIQAISSQMPDAAQHLLFALWKMLFQPMFK